MKLYLAGPMTGIPQFNFPAFDAAREALENLGHTIIPPDDLDDPTIRRVALASEDGVLDPSPFDNGETWGDFLSRDVKIVADCVDGVAVMGGWRTSRGARLELFVAYLTGKPVFRYPSMRRMSFATFLATLLRDANG